MKRMFTWLKQASRSNRIFRTFVQGVAGYLIVHLPTFWDGGGDLWLAVKALLVGSLAAGISAVWKTAESDLQASQEKEAS